MTRKGYFHYIMPKTDKIFKVLSFGNRQQLSEACDMMTLYWYVFIWLYDWVFPSIEWLQISKSVQWNFAIIVVLPFLNNAKDLDPS